MLKLSKKLEYALIILRHLSDSKDQIITAKEICDKFSTPFDTTSKVLQSLNQEGLISSKQGARGGYCLEKTLQTISFLELAQIIEPRLPTIDCIQEGKQCEQASTCNIITPMQQLNDHLNGFLNSLTLEQLFASNLSWNKQAI